MGIVKTTNNIIIILGTTNNYTMHMIINRCLLLLGKILSSDVTSQENRQFWYGK